MRLRITVLISSLIIASYFLPSGVCSWEDNLEIGISVSIKGKIPKVKAAPLNTDQDIPTSTLSGIAIDSKILVPPISTEDTGNAQSKVGDTTAAISTNQGSLTGTESGIVTDSEITAIPASDSDVSAPSAVPRVQDSLNGNESDAVTDSDIIVIPSTAAAGDQENIKPETVKETPYAGSDTENPPESGNEPSKDQ